MLAKLHARVFRQFWRIRESRSDKHNMEVCIDLGLLDFTCSDDKSLIRASYAFDLHILDGTISTAMKIVSAFVTFYGFDLPAIAFIHLPYCLYCSHFDQFVLDRIPESRPIRWDCFNRFDFDVQPKAAFESRCDLVLENDAVASGIDCPSCPHARLKDLSCIPLSWGWISGYCLILSLLLLMKNGNAHLQSY